MQLHNQRGCQRDQDEYRKDQAEQNRGRCTRETQSRSIQITVVQAQQCRQCGGYSQR